jgi:hypothetical protein
MIPADKPISRATLAMAYDVAEDPAYDTAELMASVGLLDHCWTMMNLPRSDGEPRHTAYINRSDVRHLTGMDHRTAVGALDASKLNWISVDGRGQQMVWVNGHAEAGQYTPLAVLSEPERDRWCPVGLLTPANTMWRRRGGLGATAWRLTLTLCGRGRDQEPFHVNDVREWLVLDRASANRLLVRTADYGLIEHVGSPRSGQWALKVATVEQWDQRSESWIYRDGVTNREDRRIADFKTERRILDEYRLRGILKGIDGQPPEDLPELPGDVDFWLNYTRRHNPAFDWNPPIDDLVLPRDYEQPKPASEPWWAEFA